MLINCRGGKSGRRVGFGWFELGLDRAHPSRGHACATFPGRVARPGDPSLIVAGRRLAPHRPGCRPWRIVRRGASSILPHPGAAGVPRRRERAGARAVDRCFTASRINGSRWYRHLRAPCDGVRRNIVHVVRSPTSAWGRWSA